MTWVEDQEFTKILAGRVQEIQKSLALDNMPVLLSPSDRNPPQIDQLELEEQLEPVAPPSSFKTPYTDQLEKLFTDYEEMKVQPKMLEFFDTFADLHLRRSMFEQYQQEYY
jgi:hypothetical protein